MSASLAAAESENATSNSCAALNLVSEEDGLHRRAFSALKPLEKVGSRVQKTSCTALLEKIQHPAEDVLIEAGI
jgi:hypothetical protein